jgi:hypothetical protein
MNIPDHISESLEIIFWVKTLKFIDAEPDMGSEIFLTLDSRSGMEKIRIRDKHPRSATLLLGIQNQNLTIKRPSV